MKKARILLVSIFILFSSVYADEYVIYSGSSYQYNEILKGFTSSQFLIKYSDEEKVFYLFTSDILNKTWITITENDLEKLRSILNKFIEWEKIAIEKQIIIDKDIPESTIRTEVTWKYGDDWYSNSNFEIYFLALSQNEKRHQLVIHSNKVESSKNEFITSKLDALYLDIEQVISLFNGIGKEQVNRIFEERLKSKKNQDLFQ